MGNGIETGAMESESVKCTTQCAGCAHLHYVNLDGRQNHLISAWASGIWFTQWSETASSASDPMRPQWFAFIERSRLARAGPPLNIVYCVYLN